MEKLKAALVSALKSASNIRTLQPDERVTVVVSGTSGVGRGQQKRSVVRSSGDASASGNRVEIVVNKDDAGGSSGRPSTMTLSVKKSDIDSFAKGTTSLEEFTRKVSTQIN